MPRQVRIEFPGAMYHVMARGDRREPIVTDDQDRKTFVRTLGEACERAGFRVHAYVLMSNHYHLLLETPQGNLARGMGWLQNAFTRRINTRHRLWGHVFGGRYKSILVEPGNCFWALLDYIHLNPVRAGMISETEGMEQYRWSSLQDYLSPSAARHKWLETKTAFSVVGCQDTAAGRKAFLETLESRVDWKNPAKAGAVYSEGEGRPQLAVHSELRRGWFFGSQEFREKLLQLGSGKLKQRAACKADGYHGADLRDHGENQAHRLIQAGLQHFQITLADLQDCPKNDPRKALLAEIIQSETTIRLDWISSQLRMGSRAWCCHQIKISRHKMSKDRHLRASRNLIRNIINND